MPSQEKHHTKEPKTIWGALKDNNNNINELETFMGVKKELRAMNTHIISTSKQTKN